MALIPNDCGNFRDAWVHLQVNPDSPLSSPGGSIPWNCRCATAKANSTPTPGSLADLQGRHQIVLQYALPTGAAANGRFPDNPNGSALDIAGICDATGLVLGLMPHPEAHVASFQHPAWTPDKETCRRQGLPYPDRTGAGLAIFSNAVNYLASIV